MALPSGAVHRSVPEMPDITHEMASQGMKVLYQPYPGARPEVGVITQVKERDAFVLYLGDTTPKLTRLSDLTFWDGP